MTDRQNAKFSMYTVVDAILDANSAAVATVAALGTAHTNLKAKIAAISNTAEQQQTVTSGVTPDKNFTRESLRNTTVTNAGLLYAYAVSVNDIILQSLSKLTYSDLKSLKDDELGEKAQTIHDNANTHIASLPPFGITAATLTSYQTLIDTYTAKAPAPRAKQSEQVALTEQVKTLISETDALLKNTMDKLMLNFKTSDVEFYNTYIAAREIIDQGNIPTQIVGEITSSTSGNELSDVLVEVVGQSYSGISDSDGVYSVKVPVPGTYSVKFTKADYFPQTIPGVVVTLGQKTVVDVELVPTPA